jgi:prepilin-type processing-associated H-X9-DG protein
VAFGEWSPPLSSQRGQPSEENHLLPSSRHGGVFTMTFCDGHTKAVSEEIQFRVYHYLMTSDGRTEYAKERQIPLADYMVD